MDVSPVESPIVEVLATRTPDSASDPSDPAPASFTPAASFALALRAREELCSWKGKTSN